MSIRSPVLASGVLGLALIVLVVAQVAATPGLNPRVDQMPLSAEKAGLISAGRVVRSAHVSLVVFQPDFFTRESVLYMLRNGYGLDVATQIVEPSLCMPFATAPGGVTLYLFSGPISVSEHYLAQLPDVRDLFASGPAAAFFRAYLIEPRSLEAHLVDMPAAHEAPLAAQFGGQVTVTRAVQVGVDEGATMFGLMGRLSAPLPSKPFATYYTALVRVQTSAGTDLATDQAPCNIYPWMASEAALFLFPRLSGDVLSGGDQAVISMWRTAYDLPDVRFGPLSLETAYLLTTVRYQLAATPASVALAAHCATTGITCGGAAATIPLR